MEAGRRRRRRSERPTTPIAATDNAAGSGTLPVTLNWNGNESLVNHVAPASALCPQSCKTEKSFVQPQSNEPAAAPLSTSQYVVLAASETLDAVNVVPVRLDE